MFKGVYRGQPEALDEEPHPLTSTAGMPPETMTNLMKGGFRLSPAPGAQSMQRGDEYNVSTPPITTSRSYLNCGQNEAGGQDYFSSATTRDVPQAPPVFPEGRQAITQDLPLPSTKTIKITLEDAVPSKSPSKKSEPHPQDSMDKFWTVFEPEYLGKITRLLPNSLISSSPATSKQAGDRAHVAFKSYTDARTRCVRDVRRIVRECRTHNKKYTDTHFDIEHDLKITRRRDCLDGLYSTSTTSTTTGDRANPTDVKRVTEIFENPTFFDEGAGATYDDIIQGSLGDCWLLAAFSILTCNPTLVKAICPIQDPEVGIYGFVFYRDGDWHQSIIDDKLYLKAPSYDESGDVVLGMYDVRQPNQEVSYIDLFQHGSKSLYFASCRNENETWVPLLERAFAKAHGSYAALAGGQTGEAIEDLTGGVTTEIYTTNILNKDKFWNDELRKIGRDFVFSAAAAAYREWRAPHSSSVRNERRQGIVSQHAYAILDTYEGHGQRLVKMRNPWGQSEWTGPWSDGSKEWNSEWFERLQHKFGDDGIFWISYEDMLRKYKYVDRTRIFGQGWHVAQQWTSVQVPWNTTDYQQTRYQIEVPEDTDAVVVFSQLDDRYFQGLQGKYNYTLQFRIQKQRSDDENDKEAEDEEDDYIARSAKTYELVRSNNVEVQLEKGNYTVLFKVEAKKTYRRDVEAVIRDNIWRKEKLMQMGTLYDLAHQKGLQGIDQRRKNQERNDQGKMELTVDTGAAKQAEETEEDPSKKDEEKGKEKEKDPNRDPWNAFCVVGLRVYSKQPCLKLKVVHPDDDEPLSPVLDRDDIAKAALEEAQQNSEQTPEGSVLGEEHILDKAPGVANKPDQQPVAKPSSSSTIACAPTKVGEVLTPSVTTVVQDETSGQPKATKPTTARDPKEPEENMEAS